jgi:hypothetical protein
LSVSQIALFVFVGKVLQEIALHKEFIDTHCVRQKIPADRSFISFKLLPESMILHGGEEVNETALRCGNDVMHMLLRQYLTQ